MDFLAFHGNCRSVKPWRTSNLALSGNTTFHVLPTGSPSVPGRPVPDTARNITRALALNPAGIVVNLPSNDTHSGYSAAEQMANYDTLAAAAALSPPGATPASHALGGLLSPGFPYDARGRFLLRPSASVSLPFPLR